MSRNVLKVCCRYHPRAPLIEDYRAGDMICSECGLVVGDRVIDVGPEWRVFSDETGAADRSRVGLPEDALNGQKSLATRINVDSRKQDEHSSYARYQNRQMASANEQSLSKHLREITNMGERINLSGNILNRAHSIYKKVMNNKVVRGRSNDEIMASCIYIACRQENVPRSFKEICAVSKVNKREIGRCFKLIVRNLELNIDVVTSEDFISRFCSRLGLSAEVKKIAAQIVSNVTKRDLTTGRSPVSLAATAITLAVSLSGGGPNFKTICEITGCSDSTIRQVIKSLQPHFKNIIPPNVNVADLLKHIK